MRLRWRKERPISCARRTIYQIILCIISRRKHCERERENPRARAHSQSGRKSRELRASEKCQGQLQLHAKSSALTLSFPTHYILQPAENRSQEKEKLPVPLFLSLEQPPTTFAGARLQTEA